MLAQRLDFSLKRPEDVINAALLDNCTEEVRIGTDDQETTKE